MHVHASTVAAVVAEVRHGAAVACSVAARPQRRSCCMLCCSTVVADVRHHSLATENATAATEHAVAATEHATEQATVQILIDRHATATHSATAPLLIKPACSAN